MSFKLSGWDDTITALATAQGIGAISVIRISGKEALTIADKIFISKKISEQPSHTLHVGLLKHENTVMDEAVVALFKAPRSYTGEDVVEISCHGSPYIQQQVLNAITALGARLAKAGEFTQRAFLNGKLDLVQAEAVADLIASNTEASKNAALKNIRGGFSNTLKEIREQLLQFSALIELELDFSQEDVEFADRTALYKLISNARITVAALIESFKLGNVIKNGVQVAIVGKPNAGKSTLLNSLLNENRAIVSEIAGTTRDTIEETININGILFRLIDTAGIREHSQDVIENMGVVKSKEKIKQANIVLYLFDVNELKSGELSEIIVSIKMENPNVIIAANKTDLARKSMVSAHNENSNQIFISAKENMGIEQLKDALFSMAVGSGLNTENVVITNARHYAALAEISKSLHEIKLGLENHITGDLLAPEIRRCLYFLGEITGEITNEDRLDYIFSKFCIGK